MTWSKLTADENKLEAPPLIRKIAFASVTLFHERIEAPKMGFRLFLMKGLMKKNLVMYPDKKPRGG